MKNIIQTITICVAGCLLVACNDRLTEREARELLRDNHIVTTVAYYNIPAKDPAMADNPKVRELVDKGLLRVVPSNNLPTGEREIFFTEKGRADSLGNTEKYPAERRVRLADVRRIKIDHIADKKEDGQDVTEVIYVLEYGHISEFAGLVQKDFTKPDKCSASFTRVNNKWALVKFNTN